MACLCFGVPIHHVTISNDKPHLLRAHYRERADIAVHAMVVLALAGSVGEAFFCGPSNDDGGRVDVEMARRYLSHHYDALQIGFQLNRARDSAEALVRTEWAKSRIPVIAAALLEHGTLSGAEISRDEADLTRWG